MDRQKKKRIRNTRVIITNIFMALSVVAIVSVLMLIAMGYSISMDDRFQLQIQQSGLVEIYSRPGGANVEIDGAPKLERTKISSMLSSGKHNIKVSKSGYDSWEREVNIAPGLLTNIDWIRLFPQNPQIEEKANYSDLRLVSYSNNRRNMVVIEEHSNQLLYVDLENGEATAVPFVLSTLLGTDPATAATGILNVNAWNNDANKIILSWTLNDKTSFYLINLKDGKEAINLSEKFNLNFSKISFANDSASKLWVVEAGNLHSLDAGALTISATIARNVESFTNDHDIVTFINSDDQGNRAIRLYKDGEDGSTEIRKLPSKDEGSRTSLAMGTYWNENWIAYTINEKIRVIFGSYPSYDKPSDTPMVEKISFELNFIPSLVSVNETRRMIILANGKNVTSIDIQTLSHYSYEVDEELNSIHWLDQHLIWQQVGDEIIIRDYDGANRRSIVKNVNNQLGVLLTQNDNWLYFFETRQEALPNNTAIQNCDANTIAPTTAVPDESDCIQDINKFSTNFVLHREQLKI